MFKKLKSCLVIKYKEKNGTDIYSDGFGWIVVPFILFVLTLCTAIDFIPFFISLVAYYNVQNPVYGTLCLFVGFLYSVFKFITGTRKFKKRLDEWEEDNGDVSS
jgi:hypothetical protein